MCLPFPHFIMPMMMMMAVFMFLFFISSPSSLPLTAHFSHAFTHLTKSECNIRIEVLHHQTNGEWYTESISYFISSKHKRCDKTDTHTHNVRMSDCFARDDSRNREGEKQEQKQHEPSTTAQESISFILYRKRYIEKF